MSRYLVLGLTALLLGCPDAPQGTPPTDDDDDDVASACSSPSDLDESAFRIVFPGDVGPHHPAPVLPSDYYLIEEDDGRLRASWDDLMIPYGLDHTDGFPTLLPILLPFTAEVDGATVTPERFVLFEVGEPGDPIEPLGFLLHHREDEDLVHLAPTTPLPEDTVVAVAALWGIQATDGADLGSPAHYRCLRDGWDHPDYALTSAGVNAAADQLVAGGYAEDDIVYLSTFHTARPHARLVSAAEAMAELAGTLHGDFTHVIRATDDTDHLVPDVTDRLPTDFSTSDLFPYLHTFVHGELTLPDVRDALDGGAPTGEEGPIPFTLLIPPLESGEILPVVLYTHGIASCRETALWLSSAFNAQGAIIAAIDDREHYTRHDPDATECEADVYAMAFMDMFDPPATDERFALTAVDQLAFQHFLETDLDLLLSDLAFESGLSEAPRTGTIHYLGHSLGGMLSATAVSAFPDPPDGALATSCAGASMFSLVFPALEQGLFREPQTESNLLMYLEMATALPMAEVGSHAPFVQTDFLLQAALDDPTLHNSMSEALALTAGLPLLEPTSWEVPFLVQEPTPAADNLSDGRTGGLFQFDPAHHTLLFHATDSDPLLAWRAQTQVWRFFDERVVYDAYSLE